MILITLHSGLRKSYGLTAIPAYLWIRTERKGIRITLFPSTGIKTVGGARVGASIGWPDGLAGGSVATLLRWCHAWHYFNKVTTKDELTYLN